jgi:hypothetical protein
MRLNFLSVPPFALEHLQQLDAGHLIYHSPKPKPDEPGDLVLTPLELIGKDKRPILAKILPFLASNGRNTDIFGVSKAEFRR